MKRWVALLLVLSFVRLTGQTDEAAPPFVPELAKEAARKANDAYAKGNFEVARKAFSELAKLQPNDPVVLTNLGLSEFMAGDNGAAETALLAALQLKIDAAPAWMTLGMVYMDSERDDAALAALAQAVVYDANNARAHNYLGVVAGRKAWFDAAEAELRKAIAIDPNYAEANYNLAVVYLQRKPPAIELARRHYQRAMKLGAEADPEIEEQLKTP